jgi:hypothetical protein
MTVCGRFMSAIALAGTLPCCRKFVGCHEIRAIYLPVWMRARWLRSSFIMKRNAVA